jgi:hypothetical protein
MEARSSPPVSMTRSPVESPYSCPERRYNCSQGDGNDGPSKDPLDRAPAGAGLAGGGVWGLAGELGIKSSCAILDAPAWKQDGHQSH